MSDLIGHLLHALPFPSCPPFPVKADLIGHLRHGPTFSVKADLIGYLRHGPTFPVMADLIGYLRHARLRPGIYTENKMDYDLLFEMK